MSPEPPPKTRGILLAGGRGTRLYPMTTVVGKHMQPIYDKPMIYYSLTTLLLAGIREVLVISSPEDLPHLRGLLGDGAKWGVDLSYAVQPEPRGIAEALVIGEPFIGDDRVLLMLGDNIIYGGLDFLRRAVAEPADGATIFVYQVKDPTAYGVVEFDERLRAISLEEKPAEPRSSWAVVGIYLYGPECAQRARTLKPSGRGELEVTDLNRTYLDDGRLSVRRLGRGVAWFDTGTPENLLEASNFVRAIETRQGLIIGSPEEAAYHAGFCSLARFESNVRGMPHSPYRACLERVLREERAELRSRRE